MKKILILIVLLIPTLAGCSNTAAIEMANKSEFDVAFTKLDNEKFEATFDVSGLPNEEEFAQINSIILDSMASIGMNLGQEYKVSVYSNLQKDKTADPIFGTVSNLDGNLTGELINITTEKYIELSTQ